MSLNNSSPSYSIEVLKSKKRDLWFSCLWAQNISIGFYEYNQVLSSMELKSNTKSLTYTIHIEKIKAHKSSQIAKINTHKSNLIAEINSQENNLIAKINTHKSNLIAEIVTYKINLTAEIDIQKNNPIAKIIHKQIISIQLNLFNPCYLFWLACFIL